MVDCRSGGRSGRISPDSERPRPTKVKTARRFRALGGDPKVADFLAEYFEPEPEDDREERQRASRDETAARFRRAGIAPEVADRLAEHIEPEDERDPSRRSTRRCTRRSSTRACRRSWRERWRRRCGAETEVEVGPIEGKRTLGRATEEAATDRGHEVADADHHGDHEHLHLEPPLRRRLHHPPRRRPLLVLEA